MALQKTIGNRGDVEHIVKRLQAGYSFEESQNGMVMPIDPGTPERPGWAYKNRELLEKWAREGLPPPVALSEPIKRPIGHVTTPDGKVWALHSDGTRSEVKPREDVLPAKVEALKPDTGIPMQETDIPKEAKRSRKKLKPKWPEEK